MTSPQQPLLRESVRTMELNDRMEFDHVIEVLADGTVIDGPPNLYAPNLYDGEIDDAAWTLMDGYSGQDRYSGPIMHNSEFIGGGMERDILATPGYYVAIAGYWSPEPDEPEGESLIEGWAVATMAPRWVCPLGCGRVINDSDADMIVDHVKDGCR